MPFGFGFFADVGFALVSELPVNGGMMSEPSDVLLTAVVFTGADFISAAVVEVSTDFSAADSVEVGIASVVESVAGAFGSGAAPPHATHAMSERETNNDVRMTCS